ncbi:MAG: hypothetical protein NVS1B12_06730 [Acidimicrobiales bacterium]
MPPTSSVPGDEPTRAIPVPPPPAPPAPPPPLAPPAYGGPPPGEPPSNPNRTIAWVALGLAVVLVILIALLLAFRHKSKATPVAVTTTTSPASTTTEATTTTSTSTTSTTVRATTTTSPPTTVAVAAGNRPATAAEQRQILADVGDSHPGYQVSVLRIANSDNSWAALKYDGGPTQQSFQEVRHLSGGHWQAVATGTAQVDCDPSVPPQVQKDFANVLGSC